jgi:hypothetical protein
VGVWNPTEIISFMRQQLERSQADLDEHNAYHGLDSFSETQLHPLLYQAFAGSPMGSYREVGYPSSPKTRPNDAQRQRCDLVLTPRSGQHLFDPIDEQRARDKAVGTLFESSANAHEPHPNDALPEDAYWIEVKSIAQFSYVEGVPGPNPKYTNELLMGPRADVIKLATDPLIRSGGALIVLFAEEPETGPHDIHASAIKMIEQDLPIAAPVLDSFEITNHASNAWCTLGLIPIKF